MSEKINVAESKAANLGASGNALQKAAKQNSLAGLKHREVNEVLSSMRLQIAQALPKHLTADRMIQMATSIITKNPKIGECNLASLMGAVMQASLLGFKPIDSLGQCYFVPYGGSVQFQIGYKGYIELARRSGQIKMIYAEVVKAGDEFSYKLGLNPELNHIPAESRGEMTHVYAVVHYKDGGYNFIVLPKSHVEKLRMASPMQKRGVSGAWVEWYEEMAKAKAIKQLAKYMPLDIDTESIATDETIIKPENFQEGKLMIEEVEQVDYTEIINTNVENTETNE